VSTFTYLRGVSKEDEAAVARRTNTAETHEHLVARVLSSSLLEHVLADIERLLGLRG
jgi:hypothetical protein